MVMIRKYVKVTFIIKDAKVHLHAHNKKHTPFKQDDSEYYIMFNIDKMSMCIIIVYHYSL